MHLSKKLTEEFRETHRQKFGVGITEKEAERDLSNLADLVRTILNNKVKEKK